MFPRLVSDGAGAQDEINTAIDIEIRKCRAKFFPLQLCDRFFILQSIRGFLDNVAAFFRSVNQQFESISAIFAIDRGF